MRKHGFIAGLALAVPVLALAPRSAQVSATFVPVAHAADAPALTDAQLGAKAFEVLNKHCQSCHGEGKRQYKKAAIDKNTYKVLLEEQKGKVVPGKPDESEVYTTMINKEDPMPPKRIEVRPTAEEIAIVKTWIEKGAPAWPTGDAPAK